MIKIIKYQKLLKNYQNNININSLRLRNINLYDKNIIYKWSNDILTRKNSLTKKRIKIYEHNSWFSKQINSKNNLFWMCLYNNNRIGFVRLDKCKQFYKLNYLINPKYRGLGLAKKMIKLSLKKYRFKNKIPIIAEVKKNNLKSKRILLECNFVCTNNYIYDKIFVLKYI